MVGDVFADNIFFKHMLIFVQAGFNIKLYKLPIFN